MDSVDQEPAYVLHAAEYKESSLLLSVLTLNTGRISVMAQGAKSEKSPFRSVLQPFIPLQITAFRKYGSMFILKDCELCGEGYEFSAPVIFCAYYLNELMRFLTTENTGVSPVLFGLYVASLENLYKGKDVEATLRRFELALLDNNGCGLSTSDCDGRPVKSDLFYRFCLNEGLVESSRLLSASQSTINVPDPFEEYALFPKSKVKGPKLSSFSYSAALPPDFSGFVTDTGRPVGESEFIGPLISGQSIINSLSGNFDGSTLKECKALTSAFIQRLLGKNELQSRKMYREYLQRKENNQAVSQSAEKKTQD